MEDDLEFFAAFEDELYKETSSMKSDDEIDSELEAALYQNVHFASSFVITPSKIVSEENHVSGDPNLLDSPVEETSESKLPSSINSDSPEKNEEQDISKYPEVQLVFANEKKCMPENSKSKEDVAIFINLDHTTVGDDIDTADGLNASDGWELIKADLIPAVFQDRVKKRKSTLFIRCFNCNEKGHRTFECTQPKKEKVCFLCGKLGHLKKECPNELCFNCHEPGHQFRQCRKPRCRPGDTCRRCHGYGHFESSCPDKWRQYHLTLKPGEIIISKSNSNPQYDNVFCYNCGAEGHLGHECLEERIDGRFAGPFLFVAKYDKFTTASLPGTHNKHNHHLHQNQYHDDHGRDHIYFTDHKRRKTEDHREDISDVVDTVENVGGKKGRRKKEKKKKEKMEREASENGNHKNRKRKRKFETEILQVDNNEEIPENSLLNTWNVATNPKKKTKHNRKKHKINNAAFKHNVDSRPVLAFEEKALSSEEKIKFRKKNQKKRSNQQKSRKRTEQKKNYKPPKINQIPKGNQSRTVYFDFNGFV